MQKRLPTRTPPDPGNSDNQPQSGKSVVTLGLMELLSTRVQRLGFFREQRL